MPRAKMVHRNPVDGINVRYFRAVAKAKRQFPHMHCVRADCILIARRERREALAALGIKVR